MRVGSFAIVVSALVYAGSIWWIGSSFFGLDIGRYSRHEESSNDERDALPPDSQIAATKVVLQVASQPNHTAQNRPFVHIVSSRFMQFQPSLLHLGKARLALFKAFCLPTLVHQTAPSGSFIWIIRTDPNLDGELLDELVTLLAPYPHFFLIWTNENNDGGTDMKAISNSTESIVTGDVTLLDEAAAALDNTSAIIRIETRLDADDGLRVDYLEHIQNVTMAMKRNNDRKSAQIVYFCIDKHLEWHSSLAGGGRVLGTNKDICVTPGLTFATMPHEEPIRVLRMPHHKLASSVASCSSRKKYKSKGNNTINTIPTCLIRLTKFAGPAAIRARTPTSAGMADIEQPEGGNNAFDKTQDETWKHIYSMFAISVEQVMKCQALLESQMAFIAEENLAGQCTKGHSCKGGSKAKLLAIIRSHGSNATRNNVTEQQIIWH